MLISTITPKNSAPKEWGTAHQMSAQGVFRA